MPIAFPKPPKREKKVKIRLPKVKTTSIGKLKTKAWDSFSRLIRLRDCLLTTKSQTLGKCYTCPRIKEFKGLQAGHFIQGRHNINLFDPRGCHAQCYYCNMQLRGNLLRYYYMMKLDYGEKVIKELDINDQQNHDFTVEELEDKIQRFEQGYQDLLSGKKQPIAFLQTV